MSFDLKLQSFGNSIKLDATCDLTIWRTCDRCLADFEEEVSLVICRMLTKSETDLYDIVIEDGYLDMEELIIDELLIQLPAASLCSYDCKGLCASCGADLNEGECSCKHDDIDPRWKGLIDILDR